MTEQLPPAHELTPSQTVGPFFHFMLTPKTYGVREIFTADLTKEGPGGERLRIEGRVLDADGAPIPDAMLEIWQADANGAYAHPASPKPAANGFCGFGRCPTDAHGAFAFDTIMPGIVPTFDGAPQSPHIAVTLFARGMTRHLVTRIYFAGRDDLAADPVLALVPQERRGSLLASAVAKGLWEFTIRLGGDDETVFFEA
ncbi:MAG: protocatechuate 3,4-dioxygenase subunit alpha [Hyphomicrobiales bacterium]|jgi:protocatechuate 3,4-dioxygenase alpha subunit|nr:protocatechuate 3,4-dioxygenase subunit alpha [Hyphomicrobiales bacterium]